MGWVHSCAERSGGVITRPDLEAFEYDGRPMKLIDYSRGIRNPAELAATISVMHTPGRYDDDIDTSDGLLRYAYRAAQGPSDNRKLREAHRLGLPIILLRKIADGIFVPVCPVYVVADRPGESCFMLAVDEGLRLLPSGQALEENQRRYAERLTRLRLHQPVFRARVLRAYERACAMCRLKHVTLLDAAHILPDGHPGGRPVVSNGISLCKIHHAAYDQDILGIRPDLVVEVRADIVGEIDGPMLRHGIQDMGGVRLNAPNMKRDRPDPSALEERYAVFRASA